MAEINTSQDQQDEALLERFGYKQELRRTLGFLSNFAVAFPTSLSPQAHSPSSLSA